MLNTVGKFIYTEYWGILLVEHCGNIYLHKRLGNTLCWTLWADLFTQNTGKYIMLSTEGICIYTKYWELLYVEHCGKIIYTKYLVILYLEHCGKIYLHNILGNILCWTLGIFIYIKYCEIRYVEHCGNIYLHTILGNTLCWALWEDLFTQNTEEYCMLNIVGRFIYTKYWGILYVEHCGKIIYTKDWGLLYVEHCGKIYLYTMLRNTLCWTLWGDLFIQNTEEYFLLNTVGIFIYIKDLEIRCVENCEQIYLHKILGNTLCWALWEYAFTQNTGNYFMLNTGKMYLHKIPRNTVCWALWEDIFTKNIGDYFMLNNMGRFIYIKYWGILYVEHWEYLFIQNTGDYYMLSTVEKIIYTKYWGLLYVEHCGKIIYTKYLVILYVEHWEDLFT